MLGPMAGERSASCRGGALEICEDEDVISRGLPPELHGGAVNPSTLTAGSGLKP